MTDTLPAAVSAFSAAVFPEGEEMPCWAGDTLGCRVLTRNPIGLCDRHLRKYRDEPETPD